MPHPITQEEVFEMSIIEYYENGHGTLTAYSLVHGDPLAGMNVQFRDPDDGTSTHFLSMDGFADYIEKKRQQGWKTSPIRPGQWRPAAECPTVYGGGGRFRLICTIARN